jgi:hypothetical protein
MNTELKDITPIPYFAYSPGWIEWVVMLFVFICLLLVFIYLSSKKQKTAIKNYHDKEPLEVVLEKITDQINHLSSASETYKVKESLSCVHKIIARYIFYVKDKHSLLELISGYLHEVDMLRYSPEADRSIALDVLQKIKSLLETSGSTQSNSTPIRTYGSFE